jgi:hypothetical protein
MALFQPLARLMTPGKDGGYPGLKPYADILGGIVKELDSGKPAVTPGRWQDPGIKRHSIAAGTDRAAVSARESQCSGQAGSTVSGCRWTGRSPLGTVCLSRTPRGSLGTVGDRTYLGRVLAERTATPGRAHPGQVSVSTECRKHRRSARSGSAKAGDGPFWQAFRTKYGPVCLERGGDFVPRRFPTGAISLPAGMLALVNQLGKVSRTLFGKDGSRVPLDLRVRALPLNATDGEVPGTLSFLAAGKSVVYGVNSAPTPRPLQVSGGSPIQHQ